MSMGIRIRAKTRKEKMIAKRLSPKQKFIKFIQDTPLFKEVDEKVIARRKIEAKKHMAYLEKNKITKKEVKEWLKDIPKKHKQEAFSLATTMVAGTVPAFHMLMSGGATKVALALQPVAGAVEPYFIPLAGIGIGTALAYDIWNAPHSQVRIKLKKLGRWADHEIDWIVAHLKHHKKRNPKMLHGVSKHHVKKLHRVM